jgi:hypothetical protein
MATRAKGPDRPRGMPVVEYPDGNAIDHSRDRAAPKDGGSIGVDTMTGKHYFYRGGVAKPIPAGTGQGSDK